MVGLPALPETARYILKNSESFGFYQLSEDDFASRARSAIMTRSGADGRMLTNAPLDFFLSPGGKANALMRPGAEIRDWGIKKGKVGKSRPVIVLEEDYAGLPIDQVATLFEYQARQLYQLEADKNRAGPSQSKIGEYPPTLISLVNESPDDKTMARIEKQLEMHMTYRNTVLRWLKRKADLKSTRVGFDINKGRMMGVMKPSVLTGMKPPVESVILIEINSIDSITRPEVAVALDLQADVNKLEYQTLLCSATSRRMLLYVALTSPEQYGQLVTQIRPLLSNLRGSNSKMSAKIIKTRNSKGAKTDDRRTLLPLSLYILPPPPKTSSKTKGMFSHEVTGMGYAIVPITKDDFKWHYDAHPLVAAYNISNYVTTVSNFMRVAGLTNPAREPQEEDIRIVKDEKLAKKWSNHRSRSLNFVEELPEDKPELTFVLPYGRDVLIHAKSEGSTMAGFSDSSIRSGVLHLKQIDALMNEGEEAILYGRLSALPNFDPELPKQLLSFNSDDWQGSLLHIEAAYSGKISHLLDTNIVQVKQTKGSLIDVYEDELKNGDGQTLGYISDGKTYYFIRTYKIAATIIALDTNNKRFKNGELGSVLISVMSEERRKRPQGVIEWSQSTKTPLTTVYESIGNASSMKGITVKDRRTLYDHLTKYGTHMEGDYLFIDPYKADTIIEVEYKRTFMRTADRYVRQVQMAKNEDRFATDAEKEASLYGRGVQPVLPVAQGARIPRSRPDYVPTGYARLIKIESKAQKQIEDAKIVGIRSIIPNLDYEVDNERVLTAKTMYETKEGLIFSTDISLDQFLENGPEPRIEGNVPSGVEALLTASLNPPVFDSPEAMDMGIQYGDKTGPNPEGKASSSKWHNQTLDGKGKPSSLSDIPWEALAWKKGGFLSEIGMHSKTHEDGTHTVGFLEKFADDPRSYIVSLKIDGDSSLAHFDGKKTVIWNKRGRWRRDFHITDQITTSLKKKGVKSAKIMGELYAVGDEGETLPLNEISSIIVSPKTIDRQKQIRFAGFDIVELDGENLSEAPYENRVSKVDGLLEGDGIMTVPFFHSKGGMKDVQKAWDEGMKEPNFEGLVLRFEGMAKSHKIKMKGTADLAVIGFYRGKSPGRLENSVGGAMLAWMLPNGDFVYAGKSIIGKSDKEKEKMVSELLEEKVEAPVFKIGGRTVDSSKTHINGRGTFTMVKPWKVSEHDYRSINWGKKPVFRFSKGKVEIVGEMNAPTMFQPSFKRWRDDKSINAHDLRIEQVPMEGTGKWGQVKA